MVLADQRPSAHSTARGDPPELNRSAQGR